MQLVLRQLQLLLLLRRLLSLRGRVGGRDAPAAAELLSVVPIPRLLDPGFMCYVARANDRLAARQLAALRYAAQPGAAAPPGDAAFEWLGAAALERVAAAVNFLKQSK